MVKINTDKAYLLGLLVGGGVIHGETLQIILPYKKWGDLNINPSRAGGIANDILSRLNPMWENGYGMSVSYKIGTDWKIIANNVPKALKDDLDQLGLPSQGELRYSANLNALIPLLLTPEHKKNFITGLVDTIGSLAPSHRRFVSDFQVISFEFKGNNFDLVRDVVNIMINLDCFPDQVLWNHPNQHSGSCRYYKSWKKGFKIRVALDDYMLKGGFVFTSKKLSAQENKALQGIETNTTKDKPIKVSGRVTLHISENDSWLPNAVRGGHFIHNLHFYSVLGIPTPEGFNVDYYLENFEEYFCPFTCLTKGTSKEINEIVESEVYLKECQYKVIDTDLDFILKKYDEDSSSLLFGTQDRDGFPVTYLLQGIAYIIAASSNNGIKGKRVLGSYIDLVRNSKRTKNIRIEIPSRGTCLKVMSDKYGALIGYVNNQFNKTLISRKEGKKIFIREPDFNECIKL